MKTVADLRIVVLARLPDLGLEALDLGLTVTSEWINQRRAVSRPAPTFFATAAARAVSDG
jgi:hypothetical protein